MMNTILAFISIIALASGITEEDEGVKYADKCEVCKILAVELESRLKETGKSKEVLETGYSLDDVKPKKKINYKKSELRLLESKEGVCERILEYNIHKERGDSTRFARGRSQTFDTLHGLVDKGVKVDLGIPYELWDKPSVEITNLKSRCENMLENYEDVIETWYLEGGDADGTPLSEYLCAQHVLTKDQTGCLKEELVVSSKTQSSKTDSMKSSTGKSKMRGDRGALPEDSIKEKEEL